MTSEIVQGIPTSEPAISLANQAIIPYLVNALARLISPPIQIRVSQAPFSATTSFQSIALPISMIPTPSMATMVASILVMLPVAQSTSARTKTPLTIFSPRDIGPIFSSSLRAISLASGVLSISGG